MELIDHLEEKAMQELNGNWNVPIREEWLQIEWDGKKFKYQWGKNTVSRQVAINVLATS